jgi:hypothetical protein
MEKEEEKKSKRRKGNKKKEENNLEQQHQVSFDKLEDIFSASCFTCADS